MAKSFAQNLRYFRANFFSQLLRYFCAWNAMSFARLRNTYRHQPFNFYEIAELRKTQVAELRKTWVSQKRNRAMLRERTFENYCANCCFFAQNWCAKKEKFCDSLRKNCAKALRMEILKLALLFLILIGYLIFCSKG